ncbi:hypothetical protein ACGP04_07535 [Piscirickettsia salmonis]|uniref:hypothetical protein n=1 Tax=Piscirickettsia salmonis TaxID=1238 RepID=UPI000F088BED|nr:hypothetical protein DA717_06265 [Piscirickettsiaceae bacterium NZ-RLO2]
MSGQLVDAWSIENGYLNINLTPDAAVTSGSNSQDLQLQPRIFFSTVTFNGKSPSSNLPTYEGGETAVSESQFALTSMTLPCDNKIGSHHVRFAGYFHKDIFTQLEEIRFSAKETTVVFSFDEVNKQQSCKSFDATDGSSTWFEALTPQSPIVVQAHMNKVHFEVHGSLYTYVEFSGHHMADYTNQYALQRVSQLNIAKDVSFG